ncbi:MAG TPA: HAMP domain-containing sensor histidine kinase [Saprospiraceae bacterium]|nr:HAMP domain-containing sensor histidine kinase [Saprospiraceae bacterium]HNT20992.1 HAMP domain-containing sensor histidine kinase [Saprospiraceae bacterium]
MNNYPGRILKPLMWLSLFFLCVFLGVYLKKSYQAEKEALQKEVGYLFINAVKNIEGGLLNRLVFRPDSTDHIIVRHLFDSNDSTQTLDFIGKSSMPLPEGKTRIKIAVSKEKQVSLQETEGMISMIVQMDQDSLSGDSLVRIRPMEASSKIATELRNRFELNLQAAGLPVKYTFTQFRDTGNLQDDKKDIAGSYFDIASGERYEVALSQYRGLVLKKMAPEIILAGLLLLCLGLAFYSMARTIKREKQLLAIKSDFIQNMTHELKTPISTVGVALEALQDFDAIQDSRKREEYLNISKNELNRLSLLVDRVLSVSGIDKALPPAHPERIDLAALVNSIADSFRVQTEKQNITIDVHIKDDPLVLHADRQWVAGIVYNLMDNAIKYGNKDGGRVDVFLTREAGQIGIRVKDNGPGIGREYQSRVFDRFYRIPQGNVHTVKGHGLGLAYVRRVVKEMGGKINLESEAGKGAVFTVSLPS